MCAFPQTHCPYVAIAAVGNTTGYWLPASGLRDIIRPGIQIMVIQRLNFLPARNAGSLWINDTAEKQGDLCSVEEVEERRYHFIWVLLF